MIKRTVGSVLLVFGTLLIIGSLVLVAYNLWDDARAEEQVENVLEQLEALQQRPASDAPEQSGNPAGSQTDPAVSENEPTNDPPAESVIPDFKLNPEMDMPAVEIDGYRYVGTVEIPTLELKLPVMEVWDYTRLKISPCRYKGSAYSGGFIICGHNYSSHFGSIKNLQPGDPVIFMDMDGNVFRYAVAMQDIIAKENVEDMEDGGWDLTLFTCTLARVTRVTVRCNKVSEEPAL